MTSWTTGWSVMAEVAATRGAVGESVIDLRFEGALAVLTLDRPARANALDDELVGQLLAALDEVANSSARVLELRGSGRTFCGGLDLGAATDNDDSDWALRLCGIGMLLDHLSGLPQVTVATVQGRAVGAGADLVAACDIRRGIDGPQFRFPGASFGLVLGVGRLAAITSHSFALNAVSSGRWVDSTAAFNAGLLTWDGDDGQAQRHLDTVIADATALDEPTWRLASRALRPDPHTTQALPDVVRSVARPGLADRIRTYRDRAQRSAHIA